MTSKEFYKTYQADDTLSDLSWQLLYLIGDFGPTHVLEFGCGTGKHLAQLNNTGTCTIGIDISPANVAKAIHKYDLPCVICGDETYLRNLCNIDVVFTCSVLDHIEDITSIVEELKRISNKAVIIAETRDVPEGSKFYYEHNYEAMGFEPTEYDWYSDQDKCHYQIWIYKKP